MPDLHIIMEKLKDQDKKLEKIEGAIINLAVQDNKILNLQIQVDAIFKKYDEFLKPDGVYQVLKTSIEVVKSQQNNCKINTISGQVKAIWVAIIVMALGVIGKALY